MPLPKVTNLNFNQIFILHTCKVVVVKGIQHVFGTTENSQYYQSYLFLCQVSWNSKKLSSELNYILS